MKGSDPSARKHVLIVDDDSEIASLMKDILAQKDIEGVVAEDGLKAIDLTNRIRFDLIILDLRLPLLSGFWFCKAFKDRPETREIPVVMVSAIDGSGERRRAEELGASGYLHKPFRASELLRVVESAFCGRGPGDLVVQ